MKLTYPPDAPFAVDVPDALLENIDPGTTVELDVDQIARGTIGRPASDPDHVAASLILQGWTPEDSAARKVEKALHALAPAADETAVPEIIDEPAAPAADETNQDGA